jgi:hypothetical protein
MEHASYWGNVEDWRTPSAVGAAEDNEAGRHASAYAALLNEPIAGLVGNVADRSDVRTVAILGYN